MEKLYENIKRCRMEVGISQTELAHRLGYADRQAVARIEKGQIDLPYSRIIQIADALHCDPVALMGFKGDSAPSEKPLISLSAYESYMVLRLRALSDESKSFVKQVAIREYKNCVPPSNRDPILAKSSID